MIEIRNGMIFDFYMRLSHLVSIGVFTEGVSLIYKIDKRVLCTSKVVAANCFTFTSHLSPPSSLTSPPSLCLHPFLFTFPTLYLPSPPSPQCKLHWHKQGDYLCVKVDHWMTKSKKVTSLAMMILCMLVLIMFSCYNANRYTCYLCMQ